MVETPITVRFFLERNRNEIKCVACGRCCNDICPYKKGNLCEVHPSIVGEDKRPEACSWDPVKIVLDAGMACPPVADCIQKLTGQRPASNGNCMPYINYPVDGIEFFEPFSLEGLLSQKINSITQLQQAGIL